MAAEGTLRRFLRTAEERLTLLLVGAFVLAVSVLPVARLAVEAVAPGGQLDLGVAGEVLGAGSTWAAAGRTIVTATLGTALSLLIGIPVALLVALTDLRAKGALVFSFLLPMMIPPQVAALAWVQLLGPASPLLATLGLSPPIGTPNPLYGAGGIVLLLGIGNAPLVFLAVRAGLRALPREMVEAARSSGARRGRVLADVVLPIVGPSIVAGAAVSFVSAVGNFGIPALLGIPAGYTVLPTLIYQRLSGFGPSVIAETAVLSVLVGAIAFAGLGLQAAALRSRDHRLTGAPSAALHYRLGGWQPVAQTLLWLLLAVIVVAPLAALVTTSLVRTYGVPLTTATATLGNYAEIVLRQDVTQRAFRNSFLLAGGAALTLMLVAVPLAVLTVWRGGRLLRILDRAADIPYALPGIVLGIASILLFLKPLPLLGFSLYNTIWIIFFAYLARFLALQLRPVLAGVLQIDRSLEEAARMAGAGFLFRLRTVVLPMLAPSAAAGAILVFMTAFNELTVSALLWSSGNETLGVAVFNLDDAGRSTLASALASVTVAAIVAIMAATGVLARRLPPGALPWSR